MAYLRKLRQLHKAKKYAELLEFCKGKLQFSPEDTDLLFYKALSLESLGRHDAAKNAFEKLFRITHDELFRICEAVPQFGKGERKSAVSILKYETKKTEDAPRLFFAFRIASGQGEVKVAADALKKAFSINPKKTLSLLQDYFESLQEKRAERALLFVALLGILRESGEKLPAR
jgi:tetratricopeptide (TPR) repeat protein